MAATSAGTSVPGVAESGTERAESVALDLVSATRVVVSAAWDLLSVPTVLASALGPVQSARSVALSAEPLAVSAMGAPTFAVEGRSLLLPWRSPLAGHWCPLPAWRSLPAMRRSLE